MLRYYFTILIFVILGGLIFGLCTNTEQCFFLGATLLIAFIAVIVYGVVSIKARFFVNSVISKPQKTNQFAITFDDGPHAQNTEKILAILAKHNAKATFFITGKSAENHVELLRKIADQGHIIGNHSYEHSLMFPVLFLTGMKADLLRTQAVVEKNIGAEPRFFRPPFGVTNPTIARAIKRIGLISIGWSIRTFDTTIKDRNAILAKVKKQLTSGAIILLHDHTEHVLWLTEQILLLAKEKDFEAVTVEQLLAE